MQDKTTGLFNLAAISYSYLEHAHSTRQVSPINTNLTEQIRQYHGLKLIENDAYSSFTGMQTDINNSAVEITIGHLGHCKQTVEGGRLQLAITPSASKEKDKAIYGTVASLNLNPAEKPTGETLATPACRPLSH